MIPSRYRRDYTPAHDVPTMSPQYEYDRSQFTTQENQQSQDDKMVLSQTEFVELQNGKVICIKIYIFITMEELDNQFNTLINYLFFIILFTNLITI